VITYQRGRVAITDRAGLEAASCEHYQEFRAVYEALLGPAPRPRSGGAAPRRDGLARRSPS
jgi:hypothetical protein